MQLEVVPAIIPDNIDDLDYKLSLVRGIVPVVQIDILDGRFAHGRSWPFRAGDKDYFNKIIGGECGLPFWKDFYFEADLMVSEPEKHIDNFIFAGFSRIIVHIESTDKLGDIIARARELDTEIGVAIGVNTPYEILDEWIEKIDVVQCMGIAEIGKQGEPFVESVVNKIASLKARYTDILISVDGGVSLKAAPILLGAGAERLVSGSEIFCSDDIERTIDKFYSIQLAINEHYE